MNLLDQIYSPLDLRKIPEEQLSGLCAEIRERIIQVISGTGGHLASSLGVVELTVALHYVFQSPVDPIIWDVGNQAYAHKLLTGRRERFPTIRQLGGLSGFTRRDESEHDPFGAGHSSTSISAALGIAEAKRLKGEQGKVVAVIGDGGMTGGLAFEGLNHAGSLERDLVVILNDNGMFISPRVGAMSTWLSHKLSGTTFNMLRRRIKELLTGFPRFGEDALHFIRRFLEGAKAVLTPGILFEGLGFQYLGPVDGNDLPSLLPIIRNAKALDGPVLVHVHTTKGKGLSCAEADPSRFHGVAPFCVETGKPLESKSVGPPSYTSVFSRTIMQLAEANRRIVAITAAMPDGTGLSGFAERFPDRFYDVGIAEGHAVTFAAGLATEGYRPVVAIYSTFLQRAYDMILHDVCLQNLPVTFAIDRAGIVGEDGPTHHGLFDLSYLGMLPNLVVMAPSDEGELVKMLKTAVKHAGPVAVRYPRGSGQGVPIDDCDEVSIGEGRLVRDPGRDPDLAIVSIGTMLKNATQAAGVLAGRGIACSVIDARFAKPLDQELILETARKSKAMVTVEENVVAGGFGSSVAGLLHARGINLPLAQLGVPDRFVPCGDPESLRAAAGIDTGSIVRAALQLIGAAASGEKTA